MLFIKVNVTEISENPFVKPSWLLKPNNITGYEIKLHISYNKLD